MARMGVLRGGDLRCFSATFMVIVFFCCVVMLSLQPSQYPTKISMIDLPKDEVVRAQSIAVLGPTASKDTNTKPSGSGKEGKEGKRNNKNEKKPSKAKWYKDELPKKLHTGHMHNNTKVAAKGERNQVIANKNTTDKKTVEVSPKHTESQSNPKTANITEPQPSKTSVKTEQSAPPQSPPRPKTGTSGLHPSAPQQSPPRPKTSTSDRHPSTSSKTPPRPQTSFTHLDKASIKTFVSPFIQSKAKELEKKKIITWQEGADEREVNRLRKAMDACPGLQCKLVYPLSDDLTADAVVFKGVDRTQLPPPRASKDQVFVFHTMDPPSFPPKDPWPAAWKSAFNWTWSYRKDSDIWQPLGLLKRTKKVKPLDYFEALAKTKNRVVAWIPRSCPESTSSQRKEFIEELGKHIRITEFGPCSNKSCAKSGTSCPEDLTKNFFFLLAIEDDLCKDHVTEVFYRAWHEKTHIVPIVRGGIDYAAYFPEGTYIDTDWFDSAKQLSEFLAKLVASRSIYSQLLWRKAHWIRGTKRLDEISLCQFCYKLHNLPSKRKWYPDIQSWYEKEACKSPKPF